MSDEHYKRWSIVWKNITVETLARCGTDALCHALNAAQNVGVVPQGESILYIHSPIKDNELIPVPIEAIFYNGVAIWPEKVSL
jgi:hypothetical protein